MKLTTALFVLALAASGLSEAAPPKPAANDAPPKAAPAGAAPLGLPLGSTTCDALKARLGHAETTTLGDGDLWIEASSPDQIFPGASKVAGRCAEGRLIAVQIEASKGGMGAAGSREAFAALNAKYKLVAGGPMPSLGNGYARFAAGSDVIEQSAPHLSFEFTVTYYTKAFYDALAANRRREQDRTDEKKRSAL